MRFLLLTSVFLLASSAAPARPPSLQKLRTHCLLYAADVKNPWAMAHGIVALGPTFAASDGRRAADAIVQDYLLMAKLPDGGVPPGSRYGFLKYAADGTPIEPHTNLIAKTLVRSGLKGSTKFKTKFGIVTLDELVASVKQGFVHAPGNPDYWHDVGWTLDLLSAVSKPGDVFTGFNGQRLSVDKLMDDALDELEAETTDLKLAMERGQPQVPKRKQGIYAHTCGGLHFLTPVLTWARWPAVKKRWGKRLDTQIEILLYRLGSERAQYEAALQQAPQYKLQLLVQELKFYGHFLEATGRLKTELKWKPTEAQRRTVRTAEVLLDDAVRQLDEVKAFDSMEKLKTSQPQIALDLVGDSCHAANGWELWR